MVFHWSGSDCKFLRVSRTLLSILADIDNVVVWMISTCSLISNHSNPFDNPSVTALNAPITIGINVTFMFHIFFNSLARSRYLSFFSHSFCFIQFYFVVSWDSKVHNFASSLFFVRFGRLAEIRWSVCMSKSHRSFWVLFCRTDAGLCIYPLFVWSNLNFLHNSQWITDYYYLLF